MKRSLAAVAAIALGVGLAAAALPMAASAHNLGLQGSASCQADGTYKVTWTGTTTNVPGNDADGTYTVKALTPPTSTASPTSGDVNGNTMFTITQTGIPGTAHEANINVGMSWPKFTAPDATGHVKLDGSCTVNDASAQLITHPATCAAPGSAEWTDVKFATTSELDQTVGAHTGTATATGNHVFATGQTTMTAPYTIEAQKNDISCYPPVACVLTGSHDTEAGDLAPVQGENGLIFDGPTAVGQARDVYYRVSSGNAQGITGMSVTFDGTSTGFPAQVVVEINRIPGGFATLSTNIDAAAAHGVVDVQNSGTWYTSKIASGPGSLAWVSTGHTETYADLVSLFPNNALLSAPSLHLQSNSGADSHSVVSALSSSCGSFGYVPEKPEPVFSNTVTTGETVCSVDGGGSFDTTTTYYVQNPVFSDGAWSLGEKVLDPEHETNPVIVTTKVGTDVCPQQITPPAPTVQDKCGIADDKVIYPTTDLASYDTAWNTGYSKATVTATPAEGVVFVEGDGYTLNEDGTATWTLDFDTSACPIPAVPVTTQQLATTGINALPYAGGALLALLLGAGVVTGATIRRNRKAKAKAE